VAGGWRKFRDEDLNGL